MLYKNFQESRKGPASVQGKLDSPLVEKNVRPNFIIFAQNIFHHIATYPPPVLDTVTTKLNETGANLINIT